jgi:tetratricopeptide (TPR) repeat protein
VDAVILRALSKDPDARFPAMEEIADELEQYAASTAPATGRADRIAISVRDPAFAATEQVPVSSAGAALQLQQSGARALTQRGAVEEPRPRGLRRAVTFAVATAVVASVGVGAWRLRHIAPPAAQTALPDAAQAEDVPSQMSTNPDATAEYRAGLQALRDGSQGSANRHLSRAIELDPLFGPAQLRFALSKLLNNQVATLTSADLQGAHAAQASLGTRDRILLDAFELVAKAPPDYAGSERLLETAQRAYPNDGDFPFHRALVFAIAARPSDELASLDASLARDPTFAFAWRMKAQAQLGLGDTTGATKSFDECLRVSSGATTCLADLGVVQANEGKCAEVVATMRRLIPLVPGAATAYIQLANGLAGSGEPVEAVRVALEQSWERQPAAARPIAQSFGEAALAILVGDFAKADRQYQAAERLAASIPDDGVRFAIAYQRALVALETDRPAQAERFASAYFRQREGVPNRAYDYSLQMRSVELAAGSATPASFGAQRERWLAENGAIPPAFRWIDAYAAATQTRDDAIAALAAKPDVKPLVNTLLLSPSYGEPIGRTYLLAGKLDEAVSYLTQAAASCQLLDGTQAIFATLAALDLGAALEERGDSANACSAYQRVLARWGTATPRSKSAARALARSTSLQCPH